MGLFFVFEKFDHCRKIMGNQIIFDIAKLVYKVFVYGMKG